MIYITLYTRKLSLFYNVCIVLCLQILDITYKVKSLPFNCTTAQCCQVACILRPLSNSSVYDTGCTNVYTTSCKLDASKVLVWLFV